ncbi:MAG: zinc-binding alcohol dehydrogenase [Rhodospirillum sp.]|nr:zinc-binding alcohol dehydrogenase [Rhodospirillum sp.]MCF8491409.1 zinc-binding alcohol dehydrogenase [Rhodospirillum sp.]MCF8501298.1 zinc-binding alcohol dehydrogenase [Rhodospirillum sp.]
MTGGPSCEARALWFPAAGRCEIRREEVPPPVDGQVLVRGLFSGVSRGTESLVFNGKVPRGEYDRMRGPNMAGAFSFPVKYGYAAVGRVEAGPDSLVGRTVFSLHPHQDLFVVDQDGVAVLPEGLPAERAILAANMETALTIIWDAGIQPGDRLAVFGAGVVGALTAYLAARIIGTEVVLVDIDPARAALASKLGLPFRQDEPEGEFDVLINASASAEALATAVAHAGQEARVVEASWYGDRTVSLSLGGAFHARRLSIISSQVGSIPATRRIRWSYARRMNKALELLRDDRLDALISGETAFATLAEGYPAVLSDPGTLCHRIRY